MHILYPSDPYNPRQADDFYERERLAANAATIKTSVFSLEGFEAGRWQVNTPLEAGATVVYRGWMLRASAYESLAELVARDGARLLTSPNQYTLTHHLQRGTGSWRNAPRARDSLPRQRMPSAS
ncbi:MAG: hypothetical protein HC933_22755 [Pleurocapsa sp. SU_196_0]|nr:hypothetical protein [Pleurocapsa sp. SU_196_0]